MIVVGSGVSGQATGEDGSKPPTWRKFLENSNNELPGGAQPHIEEAIGNGELLNACEWLKNQYQHAWTAKLRDAFSRPRFTPTDVHKNIARLDTRIFFSLNFENILDLALQEVHGGTCVTKRYYDEGVSEFLRGTDRYLVKVHGSLDEIERIIFTQREYAEARVKSAPFYNAFDSALMTHTFLFLGAGTRDPDINLILENQNFTYSSAHPHYFLTTRGMHADLKSSLRTNRNLEVIEYDPIDDSYSGFAPTILSLLELVEGERETLAESSDW
ncbi:MAG: SIR2 family protein [Rhodospirillales bacterium]